MGNSAPCGETAEKIIRGLQDELRERIRKDGCGPFLAAVYRADGTLVAKEANTVVQERCSNSHAEMNAIRAAQKALGTYDLAPFNLSIYITAEPCIMCLGGIMWSGIKSVYYGVPSAEVEAITGFDEGFKPDWQEQFRKRGIAVHGSIAVDSGRRVLQEYVNAGRTIYRPGSTV